MLKENHLAWTDDMESAVKSIRKDASWPTKIIIESETPSQAEEAIRSGADGVLLDEMPPEILHWLVPRLREIAKTRTSTPFPTNIVIEASGINPMNLKAYASTGIDLISTSSPITKSTWIDFSMRFKKNLID